LIPNVTIPEETVTFTIDAGGMWTAMDDKGTKIASGQLEIAKFVNPAGLTSLGR